MYLEYYGLKEMPFTITPDTEYFMNRAGYQDALNVLLVALRSGEGFVKVTGEVGTGKTLLCRKLINSLNGDFQTAYINNPYMQPDTLLFAVADELGISYEGGINRHLLLKLITASLMSCHTEGKSVVLCLDEVQAMPIQTLETLRLLTNIETEKSKLIQVVLFGQPEFDQILEQPSVRQLRQRITFSYKLKPLNSTALKHYIKHRLAVAGYNGNELFSKNSYACMHKASAGIPRLINILSHKAMLVAYGRGRHQVEVKHIKEAIADSPEAKPVRLFNLSTRSGGLLRWIYGS